MHRFSRVERLLGPEKFRCLQGRFVTVVGLGAVGSYAVEGLARAGVGRLRLVDFDTVNSTNINRQLFALESTMGRPKAQVGRERVLDINPDCAVEAVEAFVDAETLAQVLTPKPDLLIDAIDAIGPKLELLAGAYERGIRVLSSMGAALRTDPGQIRVADLMETRECPLARRLRKRLRGRGVGPGILCVYSTEPVDFTYRDPEPASADDPQLERGRQRRVLGSLPTVPGIFGLTLANLAIQLLAEPDGAPA